MAKHGKKYYRSKIQGRSRGGAVSPRSVTVGKRYSLHQNSIRPLRYIYALVLIPVRLTKQIRSTVVLPNGLGKTVRVLVFAQGEASQTAREAGADCGCRR